MLKIVVCLIFVAAVVFFIYGNENLFATPVDYYSTKSIDSFKTQIQLIKVDSVETTTVHSKYSDDFHDRVHYVPLYIRHNLTANVDCAAYFVNNSAFNTKRVTLIDPVEYKTDCASIEARFGCPRKARSKEEAQFPIAFLRAVYKDYVFLETLFRAQYQPQNVYGFVLDSKSDKVFKKRIRNLAKCFPNVVVADQEFDIQSNGKNVTRAFVAGFKVLQKFDWRYAITLQNHDVVYKTNAELVRIFTAFGGANDIATGIRTARLPPNVTFTIENMKLFKNETRNQLAEPNQLQITKSLVEVSLSREAADYIIDVLNTSTLIENLEKSKYGMDEHFISTLNSNEGLDLPGGFTTKCFEKGIGTPHVTRKTIWIYGRRDAAHCRSKYFRHAICILGTEDLFYLVGKQRIVANKMMGEFDFGAVDCLMERVHNRSYGLVSSEREGVDLRVFEELRHVRYHKLRKANNGKRPPDFEC
uniref:Beta-1,3-galactosyl-O-glycosyl-glycoprotein beta-1,6-N-acetylglucosaminyltransferase 4 n=1 Tax=Panagrellus redivivus TaxID=6233 RepID=A0A7E4VIJ2_PANRE